MKSMKNNRCRLVPLAALIAAAGMAMSGCASKTEHGLYEQIAFPAPQAKPAARPAPQPAPAFDRMGGGEGGGGGGGGGGH